MKKVLFTLFAFIALQVNAQVANYEGEFYFTPKVGVNYSNLTNADLGLRLGFNIGMGIEGMVTDAFAIESGLYYSVQGSKGDVPYFSNTNIDENSDVIMKYNYLNIPVYAKYYLYEGFHVFAGPQLSINTLAEIKVSVPGQSETTDVDGATRTFDVGMSGGIGYQLSTGLVISANYTYGLIGVNKHPLHLDPDNSNKGTNFHNSVVNVSLGWRF
jgi:hypothetical protein